MEQYLIDTNVVSDYFSELLPDAGMTLIDEAIDATPNLSIITQIELLSWKTDDAAEQQVKNFIQDSLIWEVTPDVVAKCVRIRRSKKIKTPDAIIAATALANGFTIFALVGVFAKNRKNRVVSDYQTVTNKIYSFDCFRMSR